MATSRTPLDWFRYQVGIRQAWFLPFLGEAVELRGQRQNGDLVFVLPEVQKGAVVWFEGASHPARH